MFIPLNIDKLYLVLSSSIYFSLNYCMSLEKFVSSQYSLSKGNSTLIKVNTIKINLINCFLQRGVFIDKDHDLFLFK